MRILIAAFLLALSPLPAAERQPLMVRAWQSEDGLPGNVVRSIVQTSDGYLWVATAEGIARFDGTDFEPVDTEGELLRLRFAIWRLFAPADGSLWVATFQGGVYRIRDNRLEVVLKDYPPRQRPPLASQLLVDDSGTLHVKRGDEICVIEEGEAKVVESPPDELRARFARDLKLQLAGGRRVTPERTFSLHSRDGDLWGIDAAGKLTVTDVDGTVTGVDIPGMSPPYVVSEILEDREGNVWIATPLNGLMRIRRGRVDVLSSGPGIAEQAFYTLLEDRAGTWWFGSRRSGIDRWTPRGVEHLELVPTGLQRTVATLFEDRDQRLWVASRGGSVFLHRDGKFEPQFSKSQTPSKVRAIAQDAEGRLWFGGEQGLASYDGTEVRAYDGDRMAGCDVTVLARGPGDELFAGTSDGRVFRGGAGGFELLGDPGLLRHWWISGLLPVDRDELWVTTLGGGLFLWNGNQWQRFGPDEGLPDTRLTCILDDGRGHFWFGSLGGVLRANRRELLSFAGSSDQALHWLRLDRSDGLPSRECIGGYQPAGWKGSDGRLWFPTGSGIVRVRPERVEVNREPPPVYLRSIHVNGRQQPETTGRVEAGPGRSRIEFRFVGLSFSAPEKVTYRARLLGLDDNWRELGTQRVAAFEAVPPGRYTFEVTAISGDGVWSREPARVSLRVQPHFWQSAWFILTVTAFTLACAAAAGWAIARARMKRRIQSLRIRHAREAERSRIARDLHDDLGASLTEISILSALAAEGDDETAMRPALDQLSHKANAVVGTLDEIVWAVNPREDTLRSLVDYLAAFAREFLDTAGIPLRTEIPRSVPELPLDATARHGIFLAAREALNNLVKHSKATQARLSVQLDRDDLIIRIDDNGRGFSQEWEAKGYGVANLRERMKACGGDCSITSTPGSGVTVTLTLPLLAAPSTSE